MSNPSSNPYTLETPPNPYPYPRNTLTRTKGKGIQGYGSGLLWGHPGVTRAHHYSKLTLGNGTGCPGVFLGNPCPYLSEPVPVHKGRVLLCTGHGLGITHGLQNPYGIELRVYMCTINEAI